METKLNELKSVNVDFTNKNIQNTSILLRNVSVSHPNGSKYLGMNLEVKLKLKEQDIKNKYISS